MTDTMPPPDYERGDVRMWQGDCLKLLPLLPAGEVDLVLTDPPFGISQPGVEHVGRPGHGKRRLDFFAGDGDLEAVILMVRSAISECVRACSECASMYWWVGHRCFGSVVADLEAAGYRTRFLVWSKLCPPPPPPWSGWPSGAELCVYGCRKGRTWNWAPGEVPKSNVIIADSFRYGQPGKVDHPTQKALAVISPLVEVSSPSGGTVLDPFMGSSTTGVACVRLGRKFIGVELKPRYFDIACRRIDEAYDQFGLIDPTPRRDEQTTLDLEEPTE